MKKRIAMFLTFMMLVMSIGLVPVSAEPLEQKVTFTGSNASGEQGSQVELTVTMSETADLGALTLDLEYDPAKLTLVSANEGAGLTGGFTIVEPGNGNIRLVYINLDGFSGSGVVLRAVFEINESSTGATPLVIVVDELFKSDLSEVANASINGSVEVMIPQAPTTTSPATTAPALTQQTAIVVEQPFSKKADDYVKPEVVLAEDKEEVQVDHDQSIPVVVAIADKNVYSEPVRLRVSAIDMQSEEGIKRAKEAESLVNELLTNLSEANGNGELSPGKVEKIVLLDISLETVSENRIVQPQNGRVTISIPLPDGYDSEKTGMALMKSDGTIEMIGSTVNDGWITFSTNSFAAFVIMQFSVPATEVVEAVSTVTDTDSDDTDATEDQQEEQVVHDELVSVGQSKQTTAVILIAIFTLVGVLIALKRKVINAEKY